MIFVYTYMMNIHQYVDNEKDFNNQLAKHLQFLKNMKVRTICTFSNYLPDYQKLRSSLSRLVQ